MTGVVSVFSKNYGFIQPDDGSRQAFVHFTDIMTPESNGFRTLHEGQTVAFEIEDTPRGPKARTVRILD